MKQSDLAQIPLRPLLAVQGSLEQRRQHVGRCSRLIGAMLTLALMIPADAFSQTTVNLGTASSFAVLAAAGIGNTGTTALTGDIGSYPTATITGFPPGAFTGTNHGGDATTQAAMGDLAAAYGDAFGRTGTPVATELGGTALTAGVYSAGTFAITGTLTLNGNATDVFIFQAGSTLGTATSSSVVLNGVLWTNVFWQVGSTATLGASSVFEGTILANTSIVAGNGATVHGRLLAGAVTGTGTVTLDNNTALPVELVLFTATANRMNADLHWSTATEANNYGFEIERRQTANWETVGFVTGAGTSSSPRDYFYTDNNLSPGSYAYRIKQVNKDGTFSYHGSAEVEIGSAPKKFELESNYPNPFNPSTTIEFKLADDGLTSLTVYNMLGQKVMTLFDGNAQAGRLYQVKFNASSLPSGLYVAKLESGKQHTMRKMVLMK